MWIIKLRRDSASAPKRYIKEVKQTVKPNRTPTKLFEPKLCELVEEAKRYTVFADAETDRVRLDAHRYETVELLGELLEVIQTFR